MCPDGQKGQTNLRARISTVERSDCPAVLSTGAASSRILCNLGHDNIRIEKEQNVSKEAQKN